LVLQTDRTKPISKQYQLGIDAGRANVQSGPNLTYNFRTPSLHNVAITAPYMHDGRFQTLEEVLDFYTRSRGNEIFSTSWSSKDKKDLVEFLSSLTDPNYMHLIGK